MSKGRLRLAEVKYHVCRNCKGQNIDGYKGEYEGAQCPAPLNGCGQSFDPAKDRMKLKTCIILADVDPPIYLRKHYLRCTQKGCGNIYELTDKAILQRATCKNKKCGKPYFEKTALARLWRKCTSNLQRAKKIHTKLTEIGICPHCNAAIDLHGWCLLCRSVSSNCLPQRPLTGWERTFDKSRIIKDDKDGSTLRGIDNAIEDESTLREIDNAIESDFEKGDSNE